MDSVLVVIAAPGSGAMPQDVARRLEQVGAAQPNWLSPGEAFEVPLFPQHHAFLASLDGLAIDTVVLPAHNRRKKILLADMDSTMIQQECIDELGVVAGVGNQIKAITARAMRGEIDFEGALTERVALLKGLPESVCADVMAKRISYMPGGKTLVHTMKAHGARTALVSGGFTAFTGPVAAHLGFDENRANTLLVKDGKLTGEVAAPILGKDAKVESLHRICSAHGLLQGEVLAVGDGANDIPMLLAAGMGVALHAKPIVQQQARFAINHADLTALLYLQGYSREDFVICV